MNDFQKAIQYYNDGLKLFEEGNIEASIESYNKSISFDDSDPDTFNNLGVAYYKLNQKDNAKKAFEESIELDPMYARPFNNVGVLYLSENAFDKAKDNFEKSLRCDESYVAAYLNLSYVYRIKGMVNISIEMYMKALEFSSKDKKRSSDLLGVSFLNTDSGEFTQIFNVTDNDLLASEEWSRVEITAEDILNTYKMLHEEYDTSKSYYNMAVELFKKDQLDESIKYFQKSIDVEPDFYPAYFNLGLAYENNAKNNEALEAYISASNIKPNLPVFLSIAVVLFKLGRFSEANGYINKAVDYSNNSPEEYNNIGHALFKLSRINDSIEYYKKAVELKPDFLMAYYNLGVVYNKFGDIDDAINSYLKVIEIDPNYVPALNNLGVAYENMGNIDEAIKYYELTLKIDSNYSIAYENLFELLKRKESQPT
ncbi:MAG: tetratricopeptide repeat protein [Vampirovibrionia bacterium]